jgi:hypothetical protein
LANQSLRGFVSGLCRVVFELLEDPTYRLGITAPTSSANGDQFVTHPLQVTDLVIDAANLCFDNRTRL